MLSVTGINHFYYLRGFTDMRCKHSWVLSVIREQLHRELAGGDVFIVMSKNRRIVRTFTYDNRSYILFEKKLVSGYQFMKVVRQGDETVYRIDWIDVVLLRLSHVRGIIAVNSLMNMKDRFIAY
ncbi:IS66 family insertion sequence element accessory protein TnpB [Bacteroides sp. OttesenSCG-928-E20]|nr:IS66 family insertion sequence element accessory protein TnpB [Bacteroides sp. OttesenSCG-928-E20]